MRGPALAAHPPKHIVISTRAVRPHAGSSRIVLALVQGLGAAGHHVDVIADRVAGADVRGAGGRARYPLGLASLQQLGRRVLSRQLQLALRERAVRRRHADLVIGDGDLRHQDVVLIHNMMRREVEELGAAAGPAHEAAAAAQERALRANAYRLLVANSQMTAREFVNRSLCPADRVAVVYPGFDPGQFSPASRGQWRGETRRALGIADDEVVLALISSGNFRLRGVDAFAGALAQVPAGLRQKVRILSVGSERNTGLLRASLEHCGLGPAIIARPRTDAIERYYHAADLLFHPARFETFGLVCLEAAACGCPVLTSRSVGAAELFTGTGAQAVVAVPSAAQFAPVLGRLLAEPPLRQAVASSQGAAVQRYTWQDYAIQFAALLSDRGLL